MDVSEANFRKLYDIVQAEMEKSGDGGASVASHVSQEAAPRRAQRSPRGERGAREYWRSDRGRWVKREMVDTEGPSPSKKVRTVTRRPSDAGPPPIAAGGAVPPVASFAHLAL